MGSGTPNGCSIPPPPVTPTWWRAVAVTLAIATLFGLALASQVVIATAGSPFPVPWTPAIASGLLDSWIWTLFVPPVFALARRFPLSGPRWPLHAGVHVTAAVVVATAYAITQAAAVEWILPEQLQVGRYFKGPRPGFGQGHPPRERSGEPPGERRGPDFSRPGTADSGPPAEGGGGGGPHDRGLGPEGQRGGGRGPEGGRDRSRPGPPFGFADLVRFHLGMRWHTHLLTYAMIAGAWHWLAQQQRLRERERQAQDLSRQLAEARLQALRMQLNPHFLFNTLNAIATLVHRAPQAADEMIACLSDFLRLTLNAGSTPESPFRNELEFARRYLEIEKARFGDRLTVTEDVSPDALEVLVPTLVLQPLLENAIRHGIERSEDRGTILLAARREGDELLLRVSDTGPGLRSDGAGGSGIGLANTRARLEELHGDRATLKLADRPGGGLEVEIRLPWRVTTG